MLIQIPNVFSKEEAAAIRQQLEQAAWIDGKTTAGALAIHAKDNQQLAEQDPLAMELGQKIIQRLSQSNVFMSATLPAKIYPPLFNRYTGGGTYGIHVDNAIRPVAGTRERVRTDISTTLFFSEPEDYDGGELVIEDVYGPREVKLPAGHMVVYPGTSLHRVNPVTRGARISSFFWTQSLVRDDTHRSLLFQLDGSIQSLNQSVPEHASLVSLSGVYHNLLRQWADV
ncbi:MAG: Fe2+-dependent dioxygenase [Alcaligenaceae bacterium]|nr:Fe2+-dependent dioxygenase [Alcaligenaceae bacterium]